MDSQEAMITRQQTSEDRVSEGAGGEFYSDLVLYFGSLLW
jgi:hypothetical protein